MTAGLPDELRAQYLALAAQLTDMGLAEDGDFFISRLRENPSPSSEIVGLTHVDGGFEVWLRDMGSKRMLAVATSFDEARERFTREAVHLAGQRGRGPEAVGR